MSVHQGRPNPFDYSFPVAERAIFAGRTDELVQLAEELDKLAGEHRIAPVVALVGERRVGKTSLLLRVEELCQEHAVLAARVSLRDATASDPWEFWREVFDAVLRVGVAAGVLEYANAPADFGFRPQAESHVHDASKSVDALQYPWTYVTRGSLSLPTPPSHMLDEDLGLVTQVLQKQNYRGLVLLLDEAQQLAESNEVKQELRYAAERARACGLIFAGQPPLGHLFNDPASPLFGQARVIPVGNFLTSDDIAECALLPLAEDERHLMSPMTVDYLARLSQGKPNQIRLICSCIYSRYRRGDQTDLNINIQTLDELLDVIASTYTEYDLRKQVDGIQRLTSVELEALYNMTRYPDWALEDIVELDECFRGHTRSPLAEQRRRRLLQTKREEFVARGLMADVSGRCVLAGDEFLYLYLRFWYEVRKYGDLSRRLELGRAPRTPFREKVDKLLTSLAVDLGRVPRIRIFNHMSDDGAVLELTEQVRRRFVVLQGLLQHSLPEETPLTADELADIVGECLGICELVSESGPHHLLWLLARNLESPRELLRVEVYFDPVEVVPLVSPATLTVVEQQSHEAKVLIEELDDFHVANLPKLSDLLDAIGMPTIEQLMEELDTVPRWQVAAVQHILHSADDEGSELASSHVQNGNSSSDRTEWVQMYGKGDLRGAAELLTHRLSQGPTRAESARYYNDRGYIRYGLKESDAAQKDLERALALHFLNLPTTLLNLAVAAIDRGDYSAAIENMEDALFLSFGRETIGAEYLRLRLARSHQAFFERDELHPANVLEASYINLAYALLHSDRPGQAVDALEEGRQLLPASVRLKHALARVHLFRKHANEADPIYLELAALPSVPEAIKHEADIYVQRMPRGKRRGRR